MEIANSARESLESPSLNTDAVCATHINNESGDILHADGLPKMGCSTHKIGHTCTSTVVHLKVCSNHPYL